MFLDTRAQTTVVGLQQLRAYCNLTKAKLETTKSDFTHPADKFFQQSVGSLNIYPSLVELFICQESGCRLHKQWFFFLLG